MPVSAVARKPGQVSLDQRQWCDRSFARRCVVFLASRRRVPEGSLLKILLTTVPVVEIDSQFKLREGPPLSAASRIFWGMLKLATHESLNQPLVSAHWRIRGFDLKGRLECLASLSR